MAQSVKLTDGSYIDAGGVYDAAQGATQETLNAVTSYEGFASLIIGNYFWCETAMLFKRGRVCHAYAHFMPSNNTVRPVNWTLFTLPEGFRPSSTIKASLHAYNVATPAFLSITINTDGTVVNNFAEMPVGWYILDITFLAA